MTSKISCFDRAVFRRALKKTAPVWILYTLYELLLPLRLFSFCRGVSSCTDDFLVQIEKTILGYARINASLLPFLLGGLLAWVLFFWLFRAGTAYFYAALPVRRETLFLTNYLTGLLLCAAPALLSSLLLWAVGAGFGAAVFVPAMQVFTATMLGFLLFFSFAVLVCCVVGQMAAMPIVYVILNFTFFVLETIVRHLLFTFVYGMPYSQSSTMQSFALHATPVLGLLQGGFRVQTDWLERDGMYYMEYAPRLEGWSYLGMLAVLGLVFALCAFLLLKHREMERSGDVIAVGWLRPVALYVFTIGCALVLGALMAELFSSNTSDNFWYVLLFSCAGAFLGYFTGKMLLHKTIHVFQSGWLGLGACCLVLLLAFGYRSRRSLLVFLLVNLVTQGGFALYLAVTVLNHGVSGWSLLFYLPIELIIMVVELLAYRRLLTEKSRGRAVGYAVAANVCSAVVGLWLIDPLWRFIVSIS